MRPQGVHNIALYLVAFFCLTLPILADPVPGPKGGGCRGGGFFGGGSGSRSSSGSKGGYKSSGTNAPSKSYNAAYFASGLLLGHEATKHHPGHYAHDTDGKMKLEDNENIKQLCQSIDRDNSTFGSTRNLANTPLSNVTIDGRKWGNITIHGVGLGNVTVKKAKMACKIYYSAAPMSKSMDIIGVVVVATMAATFVAGML